MNEAIDDITSRLADDILSNSAEAGRMLEDALNQLDVILAENEKHGPKQRRKESAGPKNVDGILNDLDELMRKLSKSEVVAVRKRILEWLNLPGVEERLERLEGDKDSLQMQLSVLMDQINVQTDKILELEKSLCDKSTSLQRTEDLLQKELLTKSCNETHKLELLNQVSTAKLRYAALERENLELRNQLKRSEHDMVNLVNQCCNIYGATMGNSPVVKKELIEKLQNNLRSPSSLSNRCPASPDHNSSVSSESFQKSPLPISASSSSLKLPRTHQSDYSSSDSKPVSPLSVVGRNLDYDSLNQSGPGSDPYNQSPNPALATPKRGVVFGKHFHFPLLRSSSTRSSSAPELAATEKRPQDPLSSTGDLNDSFTESHSRPMSPGGLSGQNSFRQSKGLKGILHRLKKTSSGVLEGDPADGTFRRGSLRATVGPRLGWNGLNANQMQFQEPDKPFGEWTTEEVCSLLRELGLDGLIPEAQRWVSRGRVLLDASVHDLEKELAIKHPLLKKKLVLALEVKGRPADPATPPIPSPDLMFPASKLDYHWVLCWLDDIGLPQYKDVFLEARVDGLMLHALTVEDLCVQLKVTNLFHVTSLKRGIQVLRLNGYNPTCLQRRSSSEVSSSAYTAELALWTNHRVMEWLRVIDLSEYAPNMRGSGIHGGLMVYEPRFNVELLATLLSIPQGKTLLRRHLSTHFNQLVGKELVHLKRDAENSHGYVPLNPLAKAKVLRRNQFTLRKKKSKPDEFEPEDWICPDCSETRKGNEVEKTTDV